MERSLRELLVGGASRLGAELDELAVGRFETYLSLLQLWGRKINLTARLEAREVVTHHFLDSLAGVRLLSANDDALVIDLGSGAGLPAFPLKFALPGLRVTLVDSVRKKIAFCQEVIRATGISGAEAIWGRGEELARLPRHAHRYDWALSRAVGQAADVVRLAAPFLAVRGRVLLFKGHPAPEELAGLDAWCAAVGASWESERVEVPELGEERSLIVVRTAG